MQVILGESTPNRYGEHIFPVVDMHIPPEDVPFAIAAINCAQQAAYDTQQKSARAEQFMSQQPPTLFENLSVPGLARTEMAERIARIVLYERVMAELEDGYMDRPYGPLEVTQVHNAVVFGISQIAAAQGIDSAPLLRENIEYVHLGETEY
jgi:hypothetical protein